MKRKYLLMACPNMRQEIERIMEDNDLHYDIMWLPEELHQSPDKLRSYLDKAISELDDVECVLLPMGRCGNGTIGVHSYKTTLILPRCEDCVDLLLSEHKLREVQRPERTYFFTDGWLEGKHSFIQEYEYMVKRFGDEMAEDLAEMIYKHYQQFGYIDTGFGSFLDAAKQASPLASVVGAETVCLPGPHGVLHQMIRCEFDSDNFVFIQPGQVVESTSWDDDSFA